MSVGTSHRYCRYTAAVTQPSIRPCTGHVHGCLHGPCRRPCTWAVHTARTRPYTRPSNGSTYGKYIHSLWFTARVGYTYTRAHGCYTAVYMVAYGPCTTCTGHVHGRVKAGYTTGVHEYPSVTRTSIYGRVQVHRRNTAVYRPFSARVYVHTCTRPCTGRVGLCKGPCMYRVKL